MERSKEVFSVRSLR